MAKLQTIRFTGKRTGLERIAIAGIGIVEAGTSIDVPEEQAKAWVAVTNHDGRSDWALVGEPEKVTPEEMSTALEEQREELAEAAAPEVEEPPAKKGASAKK